MKNWLAPLALALMVVAAAIPDAEAARLGGGKSIGMQRQSVTPQRQATPAPKPAPQQAAPVQQPAPTAAPQPQPKRSWLGPVAGLAAGLGIGALLAHFGFGGAMGEMFSTLLLMVGAFFLVMFVVRLFSRRSQPAAEPMQYAGAGGPVFNAPPPAAPGVGGGVGSVAAPSVPADFDVEGFVRVAKLNFVRLQTANDTANLDDLREFTTPEVFAELKMQIDERGGRPQRTDVMQLDAALLEVVTEANRYIASVRFHGTVREEEHAAPVAFDEVWHLIKPADGQRGWQVAGIQQVA